MLYLGRRRKLIEIGGEEGSLAQVRKKGKGLVDYGA